MKAALFAAFAALVGRVHAAGLSMADYAHPEHVQLEQAPREFCSVLASVKPLRNADQRARGCARRYLPSLIRARSLPL